MIPYTDRYVYAFQNDGCIDCTESLIQCIILLDIYAQCIDYWPRKLNWRAKIKFQPILFHSLSHDALGNGTNLSLLPTPYIV